MNNGAFVSVKVNVPATLDPAVIGDVLHHARILGLGSFVLPLLTSLDGAHLDVAIDTAQVSVDAAIDTALNAAMGKPIEGDDRSTAKRRADAHVEICRFFLDHGDVQVVGLVTQ